MIKSLTQVFLSEYLDFLQGKFCHLYPCSVEPHFMIFLTDLIDLLIEGFLRGVWRPINKSPLFNTQRLFPNPSSVDNFFIKGKTALKNTKTCSIAKLEINYFVILNTNSDPSLCTLQGRHYPALKNTEEKQHWRSFDKCSDSLRKFRN